MSEYALRLAKPHCDNCHKPKNVPQIEGVDFGKEKSFTVEHPITFAERAEQMLHQKQEEDDL